MTFSVGTSSVKKGESLLDTVQTIEAMGIDAIVVRHRSAGAPHRVAQWIDAAVINAGDGWHEHPTQALLDAFTLRRHRGPSLDGCRIAIVGDIRHSPGRPQRRARRSPRSAPRSRSSGRRRCCPSARRLAGRRSATTSTTCSPSRRRLPAAHPARAHRPRRCSRRCASTPRATGSPPSARARLKPDTLVMHPGPMNRGVEIAAEVADGPALARHRAGRQRRRRAHGRALRRCSDREATLPDADARLHHGRSRRSTRPASASPTCSSRDGVIVEVGARPRRAPGATVLDADGLRRRARARRPPRAPPRAGQRGGRDDRDRRARRGARRVHRGRAMPNTDAAARRRRGRAARCSSAGRDGAVRRACRRLHHRGPRRASELAPMGELYDLGVRIFTDDGDCVAGRRRDAPRARVRGALPGAVIAQHAEDPALVARRAHARGRVVGRLGIPGRPAEAEELDRRPRPRARASSPAAAYHFLHLSTAGVGRAGARGEGRRACASPPRPRRTTSRSPTQCCASFDPVFKVNPPLRTEADVDARHAPAWPTAPSTPSPPTTRRTRRRRRSAPFEEAPPGMLGLETALAVALTELVEPGMLDARRCLGAAVVAAGARSPGSTRRPRRPDRRRRARQPLRDRPGRARGSSTPTRLASRSRNTPFAGRKLTGRVRHTILARRTRRASTARRTR